MGSASGPLSDNFFVGFNFAAWNEDGYYQNTVTGADVGGQEGAGFTLTGALDVGERARFTARFEYTDDEFEPAAAASSAIPRSALHTETHAGGALSPGRDLGRSAFRPHPEYRRRADTAQPRSPHRRGIPGHDARGVARAVARRVRLCRRDADVHYPCGFRRCPAIPRFPARRRYFRPGPAFWHQHIRRSELRDRDRSFQPGVPPHLHGRRPSFLGPWRAVLERGIPARRILHNLHQLWLLSAFLLDGGAELPPADRLRLLGGAHRQRSAQARASLEPGGCPHFGLRPGRLAVRGSLGHRFRGPLCERGPGHDGTVRRHPDRQRFRPLH